MHGRAFIVAAPLACAPDAAQAATLTFSGTTYAAGAQNQTLAIGDVNGDGDLDVVAAALGASDVKVLRGDGSGALDTATTVATANPSYGVVLAPMNAGSVLDLVTVSYSPSTVSVQFGDGSGGFGAPTTTSLAPASESYAPTVADLDGDSDLDVLVPHSNDDFVSVLLNNGSGVLGAPSPITTGPDGTDVRSVAIGLFNADAIPDMAVANTTSSQVATLLGSGGGTFGAPTQRAAGNGPRSVVATDINGDGKRDVLAVNQNVGTVSTYLGDGLGGFTAQPLSPMEGAGVPEVDPVTIGLADFDLDGKLDIASANTTSNVQTDNTVAVVLGDSAGGFSLAKLFATAQQPDAVAVGDLNGDTKPDIVSANGASVGLGGSNVTVLLNTTEGPPTTSTPTTTTTTTGGGSAPPAAPPPAAPPAPLAAAAPLATLPPRFDDIVRLPSTRRCVSRRNFRIRLRVPRGITLASATVTVDGKRVRVVRGARLRAPVDLRGLPKGRFSVKIDLVTSTGARITGTRRYRTCAPKRRRA